MRFLTYIIYRLAKRVVPCDYISQHLPTYLKHSELLSPYYKLISTKTANKYSRAALVWPIVSFGLKRGVNRRGATLDTQGNWEELGDMIRGGIQFISQRQDFSVGSH